MNYKEELDIDLNDLDNEAKRLPTINQECHEELSNEIKERDDLKLKLEVLEAEIDFEIRSDKSFEKKPTESFIRNCVLMHEKRVTKVKELNEKTKEVNIIKGAVNSFDKKNSQLKNLTDLYCKDYFMKDSYKNKDTSEQRNKQREGLKK